MTEKWIQKALAKKNKGKLHKKLGVPQGAKIPESMLKEHENDKGKIGKQVRLAETLKKLRKK